jgi:hypothetical protein
MKYNRSSTQDTVRVARLTALRDKKHYYVFGTYNGLTIWPSKPPVGQRYIEVSPNGDVKEVAPAWMAEAR